MKFIKKKPKLIVTWILSYAIILLVPIVSSLTLTDGYSDKMTEQLKENNDLVTSIAADNVKDVLVSIRKYYAEVAFHDDLEKILSVPKDKIIYSQGAQNFLDWFGESRIYRDNYERAYIYQPATDMVIAENGVYDSKFYYETYFDSNIISYEQWKKSHFVKNSTYSISDGAKDVDSVTPSEMITYHMAFPQNILHRYGNISFSVIVKKSDFFKRIPDNRWLTDCDIYLFTSNGDLLEADASEKNLPRSMEELLKREKKKNNIVQVNRVTYDTISMTLVTVGHKNLLYREIFKMRLVSVGVILFCILIGVALAWYFVRRDYKPVKELLELCGLSDYEDEYKKIRTSLENSFTKNKNLETIAEKYKLSLHANALAQILKGTLPHGEMGEAFREYDIKVHPGSIVVFAFNPEEFTAFLPEENLSEEQKQLEVRFIIGNIFEEIFTTAKSSGYVVNVENNIVCVASHIAADIEFFERIINYGLSMIEKHFALKLTVCVSGVHSGANMLSSAYSEAMYALEYKRMRAIEKSLFFGEIKKTSVSDHHFSLEQEKKLINLLQMGEKEDAAAYINGLFESIKKDETLSLENIKMLMFDLSAAVLKVPETMGKQSFNAQELLSSATLGELQQKLIKLANESCAPKNKLDESAKFDAVCRYIEENYQDINLNINSIGDHFDVYPAYLSKLFKKNCTTTMVDYINNYRVHKAKEMMENTSLTIMEISQKVGYGHIRTFNRIFKKYEGITPSAYRSSLKK